MAGLFIIILASLLVISRYFSEKKMKDDGLSTDTTSGSAMYALSETLTQHPLF